MRADTATAVPPGRRPVVRLLVIALGLLGLVLVPGGGSLAALHHDATALRPSVPGSGPVVGRSSTARRATARTLTVRDAAGRTAAARRSEPARTEASSAPRPASPGWPTAFPGSGAALTSTGPSLASPSASAAPPPPAAARLASSSTLALPRGRAPPPSTGH